MGEFDFLLEYIKGKENKVADAMSRLLADDEEFKKEKSDKEAAEAKRAKKAAVMAVLLGCNPDNAYGIQVVPGFVKTIWGYCPGVKLPKTRKLAVINSKPTSQRDVQALRADEVKSTAPRGEGRVHTEIQSDATLNPGAGVLGGAYDEEGGVVTWAR
jgi:hypothetical protein